MADYQLGGAYTFYFAQSASAPTTLTDPENSTILNQVGDLGDTLNVSRTRALAERRSRDNPNDRFVHPHDRSETLTFDMNLDLQGNTGYSDIKACYDSDTDGVGASGNLGYFAISNNVTGDFVWHGQAAVTDLTIDLGRINIVTASVTMEINGALTEATHA